MSFKHTRLFLFMLSCFVGIANAQTLYWIGGSGNFNDPKHWSTTSGGVSANVIPNANTDVVFDNRSWTNNWLDPVITFTGESHVKKFSVVTDLFYVEFKGNATSKLNASSDFTLNELTKFNAHTHLVFSSSNQTVHQFYPHINKLNANVTFKKGNWNLRSFEVQAPYSLYVEEGTIYLTQAVVKAQNIFVNKNAVNIIADKGTFLSRGNVKFKNVNYGSGDLRIVANIADTSAVKINAPTPNVKFNQAYINTGCTLGSAIEGYTYTPVSCFGICDAVITVSINPLCVAGPYTLNFSSFSSCFSDALGGVPTAVNVFPPTYTLGNICGCTAQVDISLDQNFTTIDVLSALPTPQIPTPINVTPLSSTPPSCAGVCDGSQVIRLNGGNGPYTVQVNPLSIPAGPVFTIAALTNTTITNLCGGIQTFSVTDSKACTQVLTASLTSTPPISIAAKIQSVSCNGTSTGAFSVTPTGGTPGYTVQFSTGSTNTITAVANGTVATTGLGIGAVSATVTDTKGCNTQTTVTITQPTSLSVTGTQSNVSCGSPAPCNGAASVTVSGGAAPYTYTWSSGGNASSATGLCGGQYSVNIVDNNGCVFSPVKTFTITQPSTLIVTSTVVNIPCAAGANTGSIITSSSGGNGAPYTFSWSPNPPSGQGTGTITNLGVSDYTLTVSDASLCTTTANFTITSPPALTISPVTQSVTCRGQCTGAATAVVTGGNGAPFTYTWDTTPAQTNQVATGLCAGIYSVSVKDASNCPASVTVNIAEPPQLTVSVNSFSLACNGENTGSIVVNPSGGNAPYNYTLVSSTGTLTSASATFTGLGAGNYTVLVSDVSSPCGQTFTTVIQQPNLLISAINTTSITCFGLCNGVLTASVSGGTPAYTYTWNTPTGTVTGNALTGRCIGDYTLNVRDGNGCLKTSSIMLTQPPDVTVSINSTSVTCFSNCNGVLSANVSGGTPGYTLNWSNGFTGNPNIGLCAGNNYSLTVTDAKTCTKTVTAAVLSPAPIVLSQTTAPTACASSCDGSATVTASGGTAPFSYQFPMPVGTNTTGIGTGFCIGTKIVNVTDGNGCSQATTLSISSPPALSAAITGMINSCSSCTGASTVTAAGGTPGYSYTWKNASNTTVSTSSLASAMCQGNYTVTVSDAKSCTAVATVSISQVVIAAAVSGGTGIQCFGACTASVVASPSGGTAPYTYTWNSIPAQNTATATGLCAGNYIVTIKESGTSGCSSTATINVASPSPITVVSSQTNIVCTGINTGVISATATGGTGSISYSWSPGGQTTSSITGLAAGNYTLRVRDANNCAYPLQTFTITQPAPITATYAATSPSACTSSNGTLCATVSGGTGSSYTYTWIPGNFNTSCLNNIPAGAYNLIVRDDAGCTTTLNTSLNNPNGPTLTVISSQSVSCYGGNNGAATFSASGVTPFQYTWTPVVPFTAGTNTTSATGLTSGIYNVSVKDNNNCVTIQSVNITQPASLTISQSVSDQQCSGGACNGSISVTPSGGTPTYFYTWLPSGGNSPSITGVCAGFYTLNLSDLNSCLKSFNFTITTPPALSLTATAANSVLCSSTCDGAISATATGGAGGLSYSWTPVGLFTGSTTSSVLNLCPNIYTVSVKDNNNCAISRTVQLVLSTLSSSLTLQNATCSNSNNAVATHSVSGGSPTYTYSWTFGASTSSVSSGLGAGNYTATVTDANGCSSAKGFTVTMPAPFNVITTPSNPKCNAQANGSITTVSAGAQGGVTYNWSPAGSGQNPTGLNAGVYTLTATDANLCQALSIVTLTNPPVMLANATFTNPLCASNCNGIVKSTPLNAVGAITYTWLPMSVNTQSVGNLCGGIYSVTVRDANQCLATQAVTLTTPSNLIVNFSSNPATCGSANGSVTAVVSGGTPVYNFSWLPAGTGSVLGNVAAGIYTVNVTDVNSCSVTATIPLSNADGPNAATITKTNVACNSMCTGATSVDVGSITGGTPNYTVSWVLPSSATTAANPLTDLCAGNYISRIVDANGCELYNTINIAEPNPVSILPNMTFPTCNGSADGSFTLNVSGGTAPYTYTWLPGVSSTSVLSNVAAGDYTVIVGYGGAANCTAAPQAMNLPNASTLSVISTISHNTCFGNNSGSVSIVNASGGMPPYAYSWSNGQSGSIAGNLSNGIYTVIVTSDNSCTNNFTFNITSPAQITATASVTQPSCGFCNGTAAITASGGTGALTYAWNTGTNGQNISNLCAGLYQAVITDAANCQVTQNVTVNNSNGIVSENFSVHNMDCAGVCNGSIIVAAVGGNAPISYNWINPAVSGQTLANVCAGVYYVQMSDAQGCVRTSSAQITAAQSLSLAHFVQPPACGSSNGSISVIVSGGTPGYNYTWTPVAPNSPSLTNLGAGTYALNVFDANNCLLAQNFNISNSTGAVISYTQNNVKCFGVCTGSIAAMAVGVAPITYQWSNGSTSSSVSNLCSGVITLTVTDGNGCKTIQSFTITEPALLQLNPPQISQASCNMCNGGSTVTPFGGTAPYTYSWSTGINASSISNACAGIYQVIVTDAFNCELNQGITINTPSDITYTFSVNNLACGNVCNGSATVSTSGGAQPVSIQWISPASSNSVITNLCAGVYSVQMSDANNCVRMASVEVLATHNVSVTASVSQPTCGVSNGSVIITATGGTPNYTFLWLPGATTSSALNNVDAGSYTVTVTDSNPVPCPVTQVFNLSNANGPVITFTQSNVKCAGANTGSISVDASGVNPFSYEWTGGNTTPTLTNLGSGVITLTVTDGNGCKTIRSFTITEPTQIQITPPFVMQPSCGECNGSATISPFGGTMPYASYVWSTPSGTGTAAHNLCAGLYQVNITDANGCTAAQNIVINNSDGITGETFNIQDVTCAGSCNGSATVTAVGGTLPYTYNWVSPVTIGNTISNLCEGIYFVQMKDAAGCLRTASISITAPVNMSLLGTVVPPGCGLSNGAIYVAVSGGVPSYSYSWTPGAFTTPLINNVGAGTYTVKVTDNSASNCTFTEVFNLANSVAPALTFTQTNINCYGSCTGVITVTATGAGSMSYQWSNGATSASVSNVCSGVITLTVTDGNGCKAIRDFTVTQGAEFNLSLPNIVQPNCNNSCDGQITLIPSGGNLPYTLFSWSPTGVTGNPQPSLCAGTTTETSTVYTVTITDAKGCTYTTSTELFNPSPIVLTPTVTNAACAAVNNASVLIVPSGGTPSYTLLWTGPTSFTADTESITDLYAGSYSLTVTDSKACLRDTVIEVSTLLSVVADAGRDTIMCPFGSVVLSGLKSVGASSYNWYLSGNMSSPISNSVTMNFTDVSERSVLILRANSPVAGCFDLDTVEINVYPFPYVNAGQTHSIVVRDQVTIGGNPSAALSSSLTWTPSQYLSNAHIPNPVASNTMDVTYTLTVVDENGCVAIDETSVFIYPAVFITNGFSPNGDGKNDRWVLDNIQEFPDSRVEIYSRWGELLFASPPGYPVPWDGKYNGKDVPVGTYYYIINLNHEAYPKPYTGPLTIFR